METSKDDHEIDVSKIMERIREKIRSRKGNAINAIFSETKAGDSALTEIERILKYINANWQIQNNSYFISSHRLIVGKPLVKIRELVHGEVRRYVDPIISMQNKFNARTVRLFTESMIRTDELKKTTDQLKRETVLETRAEIERTRIELDGVLEEKVRSVMAAMNEGIENRAWLAALLDRRIDGLPKIRVASGDVNYFVFEERFRGSREDIKGRDSAFLEFFEGCNNVLDIGCGRGEFLELLREKGIGAKGVDIDEDMVIFCRSRGLQVEKMDVVSYLEGSDDKSWDGIFVDQVAEHLEPEYLISMLKLCHQKLNYGRNLVVETVNPLSLTSFMNFFIDQSHQKPLHPDTLRFLLEAAGFREVEARFFSPLPEDRKLKRLDSEVLGDVPSRFLEVYNHNIDMLNSILYGPQDYAIIGKKYIL